MNMTHKKLVRRCASSAMALAMAFAVGANTLGTSMYAASAEENGAKKWYTDFATYEEEQAAAEELAAEIGSEGFVLLKNTNNVLPFKKTIKNVTLFGGGAYETVYGGGGSGAGSVNEHQTQRTIVGSLEDAGYNVNKTVQNFYENLDNSVSSGNSGWSTSSSPQAELVKDPNAMKSVEGSYCYYNDAAIIVLSREGSEGSDKSTTTYDNGRTAADYEGTKYAGDEVTHSLELFPEELELIEHVKNSGFENIVVMINTSNAMELAVLEDDPAIDSILWIGNPGSGGLRDLGKVLNGEISPSGRMVDVYDADHTQDPTWYNFGDLTHTGDNSSEGSIYQKSESGELVEVGGNTSGSSASGARKQIEYEEGIYMGYRWYETAATVAGYYAEDANSYAPGSDRKTATKDAYYNRTNGVVYPFGYGQSYTTFDWELVDVDDADLTAKTKVVLNVKVTNTGNYAGKDVVQVYYNPPYTKGGIEKATANLIDYAKTDLLEPGESQTLTIEFNAKDMASFDWNDANENSFKGYELEAGTYEISLRTDSHQVKTGSRGEQLVVARDVKNDIKYDGSTATLNWNEEGTESTGKTNAEALFSDPDSYYYTATPKGTSASNVQYVSRADWKLPTAPTVETSVLTQADIDNITYQEDFTVADDKATDPWYVGEKGIPSGWTQATEAAAKKDTIQISSLTGKNVKVKVEGGQVVLEGSAENIKAWEDFMNQFTIAELKEYLALDWVVGAIDRAGIDKVSANDGPAKLLNGTNWPSCSLIASTWNEDLAYQQGRMVGNEGLFQNCLGWYGPGANTHRSPFTGRNFEYYSQDGIQGGIICAAVIKGATDMGIIPCTKHCALNDQETNRQDNQGLVVWCNEQAMREIYFKPFEMSVTDGNGVAFMSSYTRYGTVGSDNNYMFQNVVVRDEWGMEGMFYSDMGGADNVDYHLRTGGTHGINSYNTSISGTWDATNNCVNVEVNGAATKSNTQWAAIRVTAMQWMMTGLNAANQRNGVNTDLYTSKTGTTFDVTKGVSFSEDISVSLNDLNAYEAYYTLTEGTLPEGLTLNSNGTISGTTNQEGRYTVTITLTADRYVTTTSRVNTRSDSADIYSTDAEFTFVVASAFNFENVSWVVGEDCEAGISSETIKVGDTYGSISYTLVNGPEWLSVSETEGVVYGTPTKAGTYTFTVEITATEAEESDENGGRMSLGARDGSGAQGPSSETYTETYTIVVVEAEDTTVSDLQDKVADLEDVIGDLEDSIADLEEKLEAANNTNSGSNGGSFDFGCSSVVGSVAVSAIAILAGVFFVRKNKED